MRKLTTLFIAACLLTMPAAAAEIYTYDWSDGNADYLGCFDLDSSADVSVSYNRDGSAGSGLKVTKEVSGGGYAIGFLASVWDLQVGDQVSSSGTYLRTIRSSLRGPLKEGGIKPPSDSSA